jgi:type IX secretion system PorP/SprF family membrane protein
MRKLFGILIALTGAHLLYAQQDPQFSQNMFNRLQPNPATAGSNEAICAHLLYRSQWVDFEGAPKTGVLSIDAPVSFLRGGAGLTLMHDEIGFEKTLNVKIAYAFRFSLGAGTMALGADAGLMQKSLEGGFVADGSGVYNPIDINDPLIPKTNVSGSVFDLGLGAYYSSNRFYFGLSALHLTEGRIDYGNQSTDLARHYYGMAGASFDLTPSVALKPSAFVRSIPAKTSFDVNFNVHFGNVFHVGASYRSEDAIVLMAGVILLQNLRLGYAYDLTTSRLKDFSNGSHEIFLGYCRKLKKKQPSALRNVRFL